MLAAPKAKIGGCTELTGEIANSLASRHRTEPDRTQLDGQQAQSTWRLLVAASWARHDYQAGSRSEAKEPNTALAKRRTEAHYRENDIVLLEALSLEG